MREVQSGDPSALVVRPQQPLIAIPFVEDGEELVRYFTTDEDAHEAAAYVRADHPLSDLIGAWSDLDWDELERSLDQIRHESIPTPPSEL